MVLVDSEMADDRLAAFLDLARNVGGAGRVLLFHPAESEGRLATKSLGFRLWPQDGASPAERFANAFRQAADLGYDGAVVLGPGGADLPADTVAEAVSALNRHVGAISAAPDGAIALLALLEPQPTLFAGADVPGYDELVNRASQQRVKLEELPAAPTG